MTAHEILEVVKYTLFGIVAVGLTLRFGTLCNNVQKLVDLQVHQASRLLKYKERMEAQADSKVVSDG